MADLWLSGVFFQALNTPKLVFSALNPAGGTYDAPPDTLVGWRGGHPLPIPFPLDALDVSISAPRLSAPQHKFLATPMISISDITAVIPVSVLIRMIYGLMCCAISAACPVGCLSCKSPNTCTNCKAGYAMKGDNSACLRK